MEVHPVAAWVGTLFSLTPAVVRDALCAEFGADVWARVPPNCTMPRNTPCAPTSQKATPLVYLSGKAGAGKDTAADFLCTKGFHTLRIAQSLKDAVQVLTGTTALQNSTEKAFVPAGWTQTLGQLQVQMGAMFRRIGGQDVFLTVMWMRAARHEGPQVVVDVRMLHDVQSVEAHGGVGIRIQRERHLRAPSLCGRDEDDPTETALDAHPFTYVVTNNSDRAALYRQIDMCLLDVFGPQHT